MKLEKKQQEEKKPETAGMMRWLLTYADMITLLLATFIILYSMYVTKASAELREAIAEAISLAFGGQGSPTHATLGGLIIHRRRGIMQAPSVPAHRHLILSSRISRLVREIARKADLNYKILEKGVLIQFAGTAFFEPGSDRLTPEARRRLNVVATLLRKLGENVEAIVIGHTDSDPPLDKERFPTNWELSVLRSVAVVRYLIEQGVKPWQLSAQGYAQYRPVKLLNEKMEVIEKITPEKILEANKTPEDKADNRRIEIFIPNRPLYLTNK